MNEQLVFIFLEGSIGVGKTTFIQAMLKKLGEESCQIFKEEYDSKLLKYYYNNVQENTYNLYSYTLEMNIIETRETQFSRINNNKKYIIFDRSVLSTRIFSKFMKEQRYMTRYERSKILERTNKYKKAFENRIVIYLKDTPEIEYQRILTRQRGTESNKKIGEEYYKKLSQTYEGGMKETFKQYQKIENIPDKETNEYDEMVERVCQRARGLSNTLNQRYVVGILYNDQGEVYLSQRLEMNKDYYQYYQVPGGKIEKGETPEQACIREILEETGIDIKKEPDQLRYIGKHKEVDNTKGKTCDIFIIKIDNIPQLKEPEKNTSWEPYTIQGMFTSERKLTPSLNKFRNVIINSIEYKYRSRTDDVKQKTIRKRKLHLKKLLSKLFKGRRNKIRTQK